MMQVQAKSIAVLALLASVTVGPSPAWAEENAVADNPSSFPAHLRALGDRLYFSADDGIHGRELWWCDLKGNYALAADLMPGPQASMPDRIAPAGRVLYFTASSPAFGRELWMLRKSAIAPTLVEDIRPGELPGEPFFLAISGIHVYFAALIQTRDWRLWHTPEGASPTTLLATLTPGPLAGEGLRCHAGPDGSLLFYRMGGLCKAGPPGVKEERLMPFDIASDLWNTGVIGMLGNKIIFVGAHEKSGEELWVSHGKAGDAQLVKDILPGPESPNIGAFCQFQNAFYFGAEDGVHGVELWKTDGTAEGTVLVKDIYPGPSSGDPYNFAATDDYVYFTGNDGVHGREMWRSDGTELGTQMLQDLYPGPKGSEPWKPAATDRLVYFCANSLAYGEEVFRAGRGVAGIEVLRDIVPGTADSGPHNTTLCGNTVFFTCNDGMHGEELWMSDGTDEGTHLAADVRKPRNNPASSPRNLTALNGGIVFSVSDLTHGEEVWFSDGTEQNTQLLADVYPGAKSSSPHSFTASNENVYFVAHTPDLGEEVWWTNGTAEGTSVFCDLAPGVAGAHPDLLTPQGGRLCFVGASGSGDRSLWVVGEGNQCAPSQVANSQGLPITGIFVYKERVFCYVAEKPKGTSSLWEVDGANECMRKVCAQIGTGTHEKEDPLPRFLALLYPPPRGLPEERSAPLEGITYFTRYTPEYGAEMWCTDGSLEGTRLFLDAFPGPGSSSPAEYRVMDGKVYFMADHANEGRVLWYSGGTARNTGPLMLADEAGSRFTLSPIHLQALNGCLLTAARPPLDYLLHPDDVEFHVLSRKASGGWAMHSHPTKPGDRGCWPQQFTLSGNLLFFTADDGVHGRELWVTDGQAENTRMIHDFLVAADLSPWAGTNHSSLPQE